MNIDCSLTSAPTFFTLRIISDKHDNLNFECDNQWESRLDQSKDQEEPIEQEEATQGEKQSEDPSSLLM